jgi:ankyrin repeat protein
VNSTNRWGATPLHAAAFMGHAEAIHALVHTHGAELSARDLVQSTPLHHAALGLQKRAVEVLVEAGADVAAK